MSKEPGFIKAFNWIAIATVSAIAFYLGIGFAKFISDADVDADVAGLIGAALGAAITVLGAIWVAQYQRNRNVRAFNRLIGDSVTAIRDEAYTLVAIGEMSITNRVEEVSELFKNQICLINEAFDIFEKNLETGTITDYETRLWVFRLERTILENLRTFEKEKGWLHEGLSQNIVENARSDLSHAASQIFHACVGALRELKFNRPLPSDAQLSNKGVEI